MYTEKWNIIQEGWANMCKAPVVKAPSICKFSAAPRLHSDFASSQGRRMLFEGGEGGEGNAPHHPPFGGGGGGEGGDEGGGGASAQADQD